MKSIAQPALAKPTFTQFVMNSLPSLLGMFVLAILISTPDLAFAQTPPAADCSKVTGFFSSIENLLKVVSVAVVTIAVIFAGYQIAFAHKRISDVAPILIGGLLIGAAGQVATLLMGSNVTACTAV